MDLRERLISWILHMRQYDQDYAREALIWYDRTLPWMDLKSGVREAMNEMRTVRSVDEA